MKYAAIKSIRQLIAEAKLEEALQQTVLLLEQETGLSELLKAAQINQADFFQTKAEQLKGTLSNDEIRRAKAQITDKLLDILQQTEDGQNFRFEKMRDRISPWRYYIIGGVVALIGAVILRVIIMPSNENPCPDYGNEARFKVMILPFLEKSGTEGQKAELDIMLKINELAQKSSLSVEADVREDYDIKADFPNPSKAKEIGLHCSTDMVVWGLVSKNPNGNLELDVQYRLVNGTSKRDTTDLSGLIEPSVGGHWRDDAAAVSQLIFAAIGNAMNQPRLALATLENYEKNMRRTAPIVTDSSQTSGGQKTNTIEPNAPSSIPKKIDVADTTLVLTKAESYQKAAEFDKAIAEYDKVIMVNPKSQTALWNRGLSHYETENYEAAARDMEAAITKKPTTDEDVKKMNVKLEAEIKAKQFQKAEKTLENLKAIKPNEKPSAFILKMEKEISDGRLLAEKERKAADREAKRSKTATNQLRAAQLNLNLGNSSAAALAADRVLEREPGNVEANALKIESQLLQGDTLAAKATLREATQKGISDRVIQRLPKLAPMVKEQ